MIFLFNPHRAFLNLHGNHNCTPSENGLPMTMSLYPKLWSDSPRRQLPSWSRLALSKRPLNAGTLVRDVPQVIEFEAHKPATRIQQLEKNIIFLKQQHRETLQHLHEEVERLKNENRGKLSKNYEKWL